MHSNIEVLPEIKLKFIVCSFYDVSYKWDKEMWHVIWLCIDKKTKLFYNRINAWNAGISINYQIHTQTHRTMANLYIYSYISRNNVWTMWCLYILSSLRCLLLSAWPISSTIINLNIKYGQHSLFLAFSFCKGTQFH